MKCPSCGDVGVQRNAGDTFTPRRMALYSCGACGHAYDVEHREEVGDAQKPEPEPPDNELPAT